MQAIQYEFSASIRLRKNGETPASRHFITVEKAISEQIHQQVAMLPKRGRGSVKVEVRIGFYSWKTSIFPDKTSGCYLLPLKVQVRKALQIGEGDKVLVTLTLF